MFRKMRRHGQELSREESIAILEKGKTGIMAVLGDMGYPYTVPLNYNYADNTIYFHCAREGHKLDAMRGCEKVSFCVIERDDVIAETLSTDFRSVVAFGRARELKDRAEVIAVLRRFTEKYDGNRVQMEEELSGRLPTVIAIEIEHLSGKQSKHLAGK